MVKFILPRAECLILDLNIKAGIAGIECYLSYKATNQMDIKKPTSDESKETEIDYYYDLA